MPFGGRKDAKVTAEYKSVEEKIMREAALIKSRQERKEVREFKDKYVKEHFDVENWSDYIDFCNGQGFDHTEMCYDDMMIAFKKTK